jgi:penicillin-binding protein 1C
VNGESAASGTPAAEKSGPRAGVGRKGALAIAGAALAGPLAALALYAASLPAIDPDLSASRSTIVADREGWLLRPFTTETGHWRLPVTANDVDPRYLAMLKAFEDRRFDGHGGVDPLAMARAAGQMVRHRRIVSGGSTLTMQVARLAEPRPDRSITDKLRQAVQAVKLEARTTKAEIAGLYLSLAPFGGNIEGVRAASFAYFGKEPRRLSVAEAALLVALPQSPETRRPDRYPDAARKARARVLDRAAAQGVITAEEAAVANAEPVPTQRQPFPMLAAHLAERVATERPRDRVHTLSIDARLQRDLEQLARDRAQTLGPKLSAAILVVDNATGEIRASVAGADYFAAERAGSVDLTRALRSPGSALKPFVYAMAFDSGLAHPETMLEDRPMRYGAYAPENFDLSFQGMVTARTALQHSLNVPVVDLLSALGPQRFVSRLRASGAEIVLPKDGGAVGLAVGLGGLGVTLHDVTGLFMALARGGEAVPLTARPRVATLEAVRMVEPAAAWHVADILRGAPPPANAPANRLAYKTGTSYGYRDAWAIGFDRRHTIGVWLGRADNGAVPGLVGRIAAGPLLFDAFARVGMDPTPFPRPENTLVAATANLPPPLRHLRTDQPKTLSAIAQAPLRVAFPPDGARLDLDAMRIEGRPTVQLKAAGGTGPFIWLINGAPAAGAQSRRNFDWEPRGAGFAEISVMDGTGATQSVSVRLQ